LKPPYISIVIPVYQAENVINELLVKLTDALENVTSDYEIVLVEDHSPDKSWDLIAEQCDKNPRIKGIKLSRNFGQHSAIAAGLENAKGDCAIVMDCDLQDNPKYIKDLVEKSNEGFDIVFTIKEKRKHNFFRDVCAGLFNRIFNYLVGNRDIHSKGLIGSYSLITRKVIDAYCLIKDVYKPYLVVLQWVGFSKGYIKIEHEQRSTGKSSYTLSKLVAHAMNGIISQTDRLLKLSIYVGFFLAGLGFLSTILLIIRYFISRFQEGWLSVFVAIIFSTGLILISLGIMGLYLGKIFEQGKGRPLFIIDKKINLSNKPYGE
jgi:glycosyltransferase involved in cell wall biosynthesis